MTMSIMMVPLPAGCYGWYIMLKLRKTTYDASQYVYRSANSGCNPQVAAVRLVVILHLPLQLLLQQGHIGAEGPHADTPSRQGVLACQTSPSTPNPDKPSAE